MPSTINGVDDFNSNIIPSGRVASAWVNFDGTGTVAIRDQYNVSSITDNGTGDYTVNYATPLADVNYAMVGNTQSSGANNSAMTYHDSTSPTVNNITVLTRLTDDNSQVDRSLNSVCVFGGIS